jgi:hypothetical protein
MDAKACTRDPLLQVHRMGPLKADRYGDGFLDVVRKAAGEPEPQPPGPPPPPA